MSVNECHVDLLWALTFPPLAALSDIVLRGASREVYKAWSKKGTNGSFRPNTMNKRDERWKVPVFLGVYVRSGGEGACRRGSGPPQQAAASNSCHSAPFCSSLCCNYSRSLGTLWAFSGGVASSAASERVLTSVSAVHIQSKIKRGMMVHSQNSSSEFAILL